MKTFVLMMSSVVSSAIVITVAVEAFLSLWPRIKGTRERWDQRLRRQLGWEEEK